MDGALHCAHRNYTQELQLTFNFIDIVNASQGVGNIYATIRHGEEYAYGTGFVEFANLHLDLNINGWFIKEYTNDTVNSTYYWSETIMEEIDMVGFVTVSNNCWLTYSGVLNDTPNCTGFVFQTYLNLDRFTQTNG
eukprot:270375_1